MGVMSLQVQHTLAFQFWAGLEWGLKSCVGFVDLPLGSKEVLDLPSFWVLCLAGLNRGENEGKSQTENYTKLRLM